MGHPNKGCICFSAVVVLRGGKWLLYIYDTVIMAVASGFVELWPLGNKYANLEYIIYFDFRWKDVETKELYNQKCISFVVVKQLDFSLPWVFGFTGRSRV